jgi:predicted DNA-binding transcriptional regulator AlpA
MSEVSFLTMSELCIKFRISRSSALRMLKTGMLVGMRLPNREWRVVDRGAKFEEYLRSLDRHVEHVPLLNVREVAEVLGYSVDAVYKLVSRGELKSEGRKGARQELMFTVAELRRFLESRQKIARPPRVIVPMEVVLVWTKACLTAKTSTDTEPTNWAIAKDEMNAMVTQILLLREPERTQSMMDLFGKLDISRSVADIVLKVQNSGSAESQPVASNVVQ